MLAPKIIRVKTIADLLYTKEAIKPYPIGEHVMIYGYDGGRLSRSQQTVVTRFWIIDSTTLFIASRFLAPKGAQDARWLLKYEENAWRFSNLRRQADRDNVEAIITFSALE